MLHVATVFWINAYDTLLRHGDRDDDVKSASNPPPYCLASYDLTIIKMLLR